MLGALVIVFREVIEAGLIVGIVMAATRGVAGRGQWVGLGILAGVAGACVVAGFAGLISEAFEGTGQELLNACVLFTAVLMLIWHNVWMARHGRELAAEMRQVGDEVVAGRRPLAALAVVVGIAVLREGSEVVLFLYGIFAGGTSAAALWTGGAFGLLGGVAVGALSYLGLIAIPARHIFAVTTVLISLLAAGMAAQAVQFLSAAGVVNFLGQILWDTSAWLPESSLIGKALGTLVGYTDRPTALQLAAYLATLLAMAGLMRIGAPSRSAARVSPAE
jgi:high-affinity iron transporter